jgi:hypothetical protein
MSQRKPQHPQNNPPPDQKHKEGQEKSTNRHVYIEPGVQVDFVQDLKKKYDAAQQGSTTHSNKILFWTKISALLLFSYAGLTAWQGYLTHEIIDTTSKQFLIDQRPYVWETGFNPPDTIHIAPNEIATFQIGWINYGKSPAVNVSQTGTICFGIPGVDAMELADTLVDMWDGKEINVKSKLRAHGGSDKQIAEVESAIQALKAKGPPPVEHRVTVIPQGIPSDLRHPFGGTTAVQSWFPPPNFNYVLNMDYAAVAITRTDYYDLHGTHYWSDVCLARLADGSIVKCPRHNEMH